MKIQTILKAFLMQLIKDKPVSYSTFLLKKKQRYLYECVIKFTPKNLVETMPNCRLAHRIYWIINDRHDFPKCGWHKCQNTIYKFINVHHGYVKHCCCSCAQLDNEQNCFRINNPLNDPEKRKQAEQLKIELYGSKNNVKKVVQTHYEHNNGNYFSEESSAKRVQTRRNKNNGEYYSEEALKILSDKNKVYYKSDKFRIRLESGSYKKACDKGIETKKKNGSLNTSKCEDKAYELLRNVFPMLIRQYRSEVYPFNCDFYDPITEMYIEYNGCWTHNDHPFDETNEDDLKIVNKWKSKNTKFYDNAVKTWTVRDINKRNVAKSNNLNYVELWNLQHVHEFCENLKRKTEYDKQRENRQSVRN